MPLPSCSYQHATPCVSASRGSRASPTLPLRTLRDHCRPPWRRETGARRRPSRACIRRAHVVLTLSTYQEGEEILEWDVVEYDNPDSATGKSVGLVMQVVGIECIITPLIRERTSGLWLESFDEVDGHSVPVSAVRLLEHDFSVRMDPDRVSNPHGEHAQNIWSITDPRVSGEFDDPEED